MTRHAKGKGGGLGGVFWCAMKPCDGRKPKSHKQTKAAESACEGSMATLWGVRDIADVCVTSYKISLAR